MEELEEEEEESWFIKEPTQEEVLERVYGCLLKLEQDVGARISIMQNQRRRHPQELTALNGLQVMRDQLVQLHAEFELYTQFQAKTEEEEEEEEPENPYGQQLTQWKTKVSELNAELEEAHAESEQRKEAEQQLLHTLDQLRQQQQSLHEDQEIRRQQHQEEKQQLLDRTDDLHAQIRELQQQQQQPKEEEQQDHHYCLQKHKELEAKLEEAQKQERELQTELELLRAHEGELEQQQEQQQTEFNDTLSALRRQLQVLKDEVEQQLEQVAAEKEAHYQPLLSSAEARNNDLLQQLESIQQELERTDTEQVQVWNMERSQLQRERERVETELQRVLSELDAEKVVYSALHAEQQTLQEEYVRLQSRLQTVQEEYVQLQSQQQTLQEQHTQLQSEQHTVWSEMELGWKKKVKQITKEWKRVQHELLQEKEKVRHQEESFRSHTQTMTEMDEELQKAVKRLKDSEVEKDRLRQDNSRFKTLLKQMSATVKQQRSDSEARLQQEQQREQNWKQTVSTLEAQLQEQTAATQRNSSELAALTRAYCIHGTLDLLAQNAAVLKPGNGQRPIFFPLLLSYRITAIPSKRELYFLLELLRVLAFDIHCTNSSLLPGADGVYLLLSKSSKDKSAQPHFQMAKLFLCVYVLAVEPLLLALASLAAELSPEDRQYVLQQLEELFSLLFLPQDCMRVEERSLYFSDRDLLESNTVALSAQPLSLFLPQLTGQLASDPFRELQPPSAVKTVAARLEEEAWFTHTLQQVANLLVEDTAEAKRSFPVLSSARKHGFPQPPGTGHDKSGSSISTPESRIQEHSRKLLHALQNAVVSHNQMMWDRIAPQLLALHKGGRDIQLLPAGEFLSILQKARANQLHLRDLSTLCQYLKN